MWALRHRGIAPRIPNFSSTCLWVVSFTPLLFCLHGREPLRYQFLRGFVAPLRTPRRREKIRFVDLAASRLVYVTTYISWWCGCGPTEFVNWRARWRPSLQLLWVLNRWSCQPSHAVRCQGRRRFLRRVPKLCTNLEEIHGNIEDQNKVLESSIIKLNYHIIISNLCNLDSVIIVLYF
jgi:hypothetical protein